MTSVAVLDQSLDVELPCDLCVPATRVGQHRTIREIREADVAAVKLLFCKLHTFNAALDPRFALAEEWDVHFTAVIQKALDGAGVLGLLARASATGQPCGFVLAAVHRDSGMWRYREWVEVEALYVEEAWRGCGLAELLLARACGWADHIGQPVVQLYVTASNERALRFYRHEGFRETQAIMRRVLG